MAYIQDDVSFPTWNAFQSRYEWQTPNGVLCVDGDVYAEAHAAWMKEHPDGAGLDSPVRDWTAWENCLDGETIYYV